MPARLALQENTVTVPAFAEMAVETPTFEQVEAEMGTLSEALEDAKSGARQLEVIRRWDALRARIGTWSSMVGLRFNQDTADEARKKDREYRDRLSPKFTELHNAFKKKLLASPHRAELEKAFGPQAFALWDQDARSYAPAIEKQTVEISKLGAEYTELLAGARFPFRDNTLTLSELGKYVSDPDRKTREQANRLKWSWFDSRRATLDSLFDKLTRLRHECATKLGLRDFVELGYLKMHRVDYTREDVEALRKQIRTEIVPLGLELVRRQGKDLGLAKVMFWDDGIFDAKGNPDPKGDHDWMIARATEMFDTMGSGLGEFFRLMAGKGLLDLKSRANKAGGGFCTSFPVWGVPFIFANFNGTKGDVEVFTHEMGHAFQAYSSRKQRLQDYLWPTHESAEIHSMSLEFLCWPWMDKFFGADAQRFRRVHLAQSLVFLAYGTAVDHFQHLVYEKPEATPAERHAMWREMEAAYLPWRDYGDLPHVKDGGAWQQQRHIYLSPFYYIDYVLAQICALQFWVRADEDRPAAMRDFVKLCERGGEAPFRELARTAGLRSPFEPGCLAAVVKKARDWLDA
ncbi:MAG: M3 family oligoendopeptidase [Planctomycetes bacterium]|nr:M3 family oligoendopeptidase [Planctomycetota bacterium]